MKVVGTYRKTSRSQKISRNISRLVIKDDWAVSCADVRAVNIVQYGCGIIKKYFTLSVQAEWNEIKDDCFNKKISLWLVLHSEALSRMRVAICQ